MSVSQQRTIQLVKGVLHPRFFTVPTLGETVAEFELKAHLVKSTDQRRTRHEGEPLMRYAAYIRVSHEEQVSGYSLDAQRRAIQDWVSS